MPALTPAIPRILLVDDDPEIVALVARFLGNNGCTVTAAGNGAQLREALRTEPVDLILLDLGLPDGDGLGLLGQLRADWGGPVIVVSGRGAPVDRSLGLELGADDYVAKPFDFRELLARVRSVLRRSGMARPGGNAILFDGLALDVAGRRLTDRDGSDVAHTSGDFNLLVCLAERANAVVSRDDISTRLHGRASGPFDRAVDVGIARLRRKIERDPATPRLIKSVRCAGYVLTATVRRR